MNILLILPILFPIISGALVGIINFKSRKARNIWVLGSSLINSVIILVLILNSASIGKLVLFDIAMDLPIALSLDGMSRVFAGLIAFLWPLAVSYALEYMVHEGGENIFYTFYMITYGITCGIAFSATLVTLYMFYEFLTLVTLPIVMHGMKEKNIAAGKKYVLYSIGGAAFAFVCMVVALNYAPNLNFTYGGVFTGAYSDTTLFILRLVFVMGFFGFGVKAAVFPFHGWLPTASIAPTPVTALLHAVAVVNCGAFAIMRLIYFIFGTKLLYGTAAQYICLTMSLVTILFGSTYALKEQHFKRRFAYSTISNLSYMLFGAALMTPGGLAGGLAHFVFHGIIKITLFFVAGIMLCKYEKADVDDLYGVGRKMKITFACFTIAGVALMGVPPTIGFVSKWMLLQAGAATSGGALGKAGMAVILVSALLTAAYVLSIVIRAYFPGPGFDYSKLEEVKDPGWFMKLPLLLLAATIVLLGIFSHPLVEFLTKVAGGLV
ncbi:MAG: proton-conducting membrane transporter [Lachnospiraceae bacterium]|nr:proton-conducting membrane transporter [Lachnospiraceae bacterium]